MSIIAVETYVVRAEKSVEFTTLLNEFLKFKKAHPQLFKGVESWKLYSRIMVNLLACSGDVGVWESGTTRRDQSTNLLKRTDEEDQRSLSQTGGTSNVFCKYME